MQPSAPADGWYSPVPHFKQATSSADDAGKLVRYLPAPHATQCSCATRGWYVPAAHNVQADDCDDEAASEFRYVPAAQATHDDWPTLA